MQKLFYCRGSREERRLEFMWRRFSSAMPQNILSIFQNDLNVLAEKSGMEWVEEAFENRIFYPVVMENML